MLHLGRPQSVQDQLDRELFHAVHNNDLAKMEAALKSGANPNGSYGHDSYIQHFISHNDYPGFKLLLSHGAHIKKMPAQRLSPLETALIYFNEAIVTDLLEAGADPNQTTYDDRPLLQCCVQHCPAKATALLLACGARVHSFHATTGYTALHQAALSAKAETVELLLKAGADPNYSPNADARHRISALTCACHGGDEECARLLLGAGADPNGSGNEPDPPLFALFRSVNFKLSIAKMLLEAGADLDARNHLGLTPLAAAIVSNPFEIVDGSQQSSAGLLLNLLIDSGADPEMPDNSGNTPLHNAVYYGNIDAIRILMRKGVACTVSLVDAGQSFFGDQEETKMALAGEMALREARQLSAEAKPAHAPGSTKPAL